MACSGFVHRNKVVIDVIILIAPAGHIRVVGLSPIHLTGNYYGEGGEIYAPRICCRDEKDVCLANDLRGKWNFAVLTSERYRHKEVARSKIERIEWAATHRCKGRDSRVGIGLGSGGVCN